MRNEIQKSKKYCKKSSIWHRIRVNKISNSRRWHRIWTDCQKLVLEKWISVIFEWHATESEWVLLKHIERSGSSHGRFHSGVKIFGSPKFRGSGDGGISQGRKWQTHDWTSSEGPSNPHSHRFLGPRGQIRLLKRVSRIQVQRGSTGELGLRGRLLSDELSK